MPIGSTNVYNPGDLILSTVSGSGTSFIETKIIAATSSFILFNSSGTLTSASLNSIVATTSSYVSGSTSIITNLTASNISVSSTGSFGIVGIGTASPAAKLDVSANAVDIAIFRSSGGLSNDKRLTITSGGEKVIFNVSDNSNTAIARAYEFQNAGTASMTLNSTGSLQVVNTGRIIGVLRAQSTPQTTFYDNTFAVNSDGGGAQGFIYTSGTGGTFPLDFYGELIIQAGPRTGYNNGISLVTGTTSPSVKLRVAENGNVGIGTTLPSEKLHVVGNGLITSGSAVDLRIDVSGTGNASLTIDRQTTGAESKILLLDANVSQWGIAAKASSNNFVIRDADSTERFTILKSGGNVGIGTSSPASKLHISGSGQTIMRLDSDTTTNVSQFQIKAASDAVLIMGMQGGSAASTNFGVTAAGQAYFGTSTLGSPHPTSLVIGNASNIPIAFSTNNVERMRIDGVGNVGIGTTSATNKLEVIGGTNTRINLGNIDDVNRGGKLEIISGSATARQFYVGTNSAIYNLVFGIDSIEKMRIDTAGNVGIGTTAPGALLEISSSTAASLLNIKGAGGNGLLFVSGSGLVGIGTTLPNAKLEIIHDSTAATPALYIKGGYVGTTIARFERIYGVTPTTTYVDINGSGGNAQLTIASANNTFALGVNNTTSAFEISDNSSIGTNTRLLIDVNGNVGIGTTTVSRKLHTYVTTGPAMRLETSGSNASIEFIPSTGHNRYNWLIGAQQNISDAFEITPSTATNGTTFSTPSLLVKSDGNVGIGTTAPTARLHVTGSTGGVFEVDTLGGATTFYVSASGNVGIGTSSPVAKLSVVGDILAPSFNTNTTYTIGIQDAQSNTFIATKRGNLKIQASSAIAGVDLMGGGDLTLSAGNSNAAGAGYEGSIYINAGYNLLSSTRVSGSVFISTNNTTRLTIDANGNVGIGTTSPAYLLDVSGSSRHGYRAADTHQFTGSVSVSGSLNATASWATNALTASFLPVGTYNITSSWAQNVVSASYALSSSFATTAQTANALNAANTYTIAGLTSAYVDVNGSGTIPTTGIYRPSTKTLGLSADGTLIFKISNVSSPATSSIETGNFIVQTGNVGIGTTSPSDKLHVIGNIRINGGDILNWGGQAFIQTIGANDMFFRPNSTLRMILTAAGNLGLGNGFTSPAYLLDVSGSSRHGYQTTDTHQFTGSVNISGSITATTFTGSFSGSITNAINSLTASSLVDANSYTVTNLTASNVLRAAKIAEKVVTFTPLTGSITGAPAWYRIISGSGVLDSGRVRMSANYDNSRSDIEFTYAVRNYDTDGAGAFINITRASTYNSLFNAVRVIETGNLGEPYAIDVLIGNYLNNTTPGPVTCLYESQFIGAVLDTPTFASASATGSNIVKTVYTTYTSGYPRIGPTYSDGLAVATTQGQLTVGYRGNYAYNTPSTLNYALLVSGSVGIGTSSPTQKLDVIGGTISTDSELYSLGGRLSLYRSAGDSFVDWSSGRSLGFRTETTVGGGSASEKMRIDSTGNVGIGTTVPGALLDVSYGDYQNAGTIRIGADLGTNTSRTNNTRKYGAITLFPYNNASASVQAIGIDAQGPAVTGLTIGGGGTGFASPTQIQFYTTSSTIAPGAERMRIDSSGLVGIGTSSPSYLLDVYKTSNDSVIRSRTSTAGAYLYLDSATDGWYGINLLSGSTSRWFIGSYGISDYTVTRGIGGTEYFRITTAGNVGIGTTSPTARLHVSGSTGGVFEVDTAGGTTTLYVSASGNVGIGTTTANHLLHLSTVTADVSIGLYTTNANASARNWLISANEVAYGDFNIKQSNAIGGNPRSAGTSRFYIQNDGNVGIGTTSPADKLSVISGSVRIASTALAGALYLGNDTSNIYLQRDNNYDLSLVQNGDSNSALYLASAGSVYVNIDSNNNDTDKAFIVQNNALKAGTELFRVSETGNVGIGTSIPSQKLHIFSSGLSDNSVNPLLLIDGKFTAASVDSNDIVGIAFRVENSAGSAQTSTCIGSSYQAAGNALLLQPVTGNVGIGTTNPTARLHVSGSTIITGSLNVSANITCLSLTETSTEAVKYNILPLPSQLDNVLKLKPVSFNYKANDKHSIGLIAEEVAKIYPEFTSDNNDSISYGKITSVLIQSIKELKTIIDNQQKQIENLIDKLK